MEENRTYKPSHEAFARYFAGECLEKEITLIENWMAASKSNREEAQRLRLVWQDVGTLSSKLAEVDVNSAFRKVKRAKEEARIKESSPWDQFWKVAAMLVLIRSAVLYILWPAAENSITHMAGDVEQVILPDGSRVTLNTGTELTHKTVFSGDDRPVTLVGEAFFEVTPNPQKPFTVLAGEVLVTVLGTSFNVQVSKESVAVTVVTGQVRVSSSFGSEVLEAGERLEVLTSAEQMMKSLSSASGIERYWFSRQLEYEGASLQQVFSDLEMLFQTNIKVASPAILNCKLQATFERQTIDEMLEIIALSQGLELSSDKDGYTLTGEGCDN